ncbi:hypothetical protein BDV24DRAFT_89146 [Aspergillus arachidicola]|uniref:Uncharacterized protein n=1 Tax=Aspergillus arachidicola TaxID=656916 RepID=A0A5N6XYK1_9EURO|nr:hypothetical protein BDV24DRAFT_89146 [Aspergillus arachidicola]
MVALYGFVFYVFSLPSRVGVYPHLYIFMYTFICNFFSSIRIWCWDGRVFQLVY